MQWSRSTRLDTRSETVIPAAIADGLSVGDIAIAFGVPLDTIVAYADRIATEGRN
jgi:hypothetical protein